MSNSCTALATKSELNSLKNQLNNQINNLNFQKADRNDLNNLEIKTASLGGADSWKPDFYLLEIAIAAAVTAAESLKPIVFWARDKINDLIQDVSNLATDLKDLGKAVVENRKDINELQKDLAEQQKLSLYLEYEIKNIKNNVNEAINRTNTLLSSLNANILKSQHAEDQANAAMAQANLAITGVNTLLSSLNANILKAQHAEDQANAAMTQANTAYQIGNIAQSQANLGIVKIDGVIVDINSINNQINQTNSQIEILKLKELQQFNRDITQTREIDGLRLTNFNQNIEIENLKNTINITAINQEIDKKITDNNKIILGSGGASSLTQDLNQIKSDQAVFKNDLTTFKNDLTLFKYNDGLFTNDLSTFKNDLTTFSTKTTQNFISTNNRIGTLEAGLTNLSNTQTGINNRVGALETVTTNLTNTQTQQRTDINQLDVNSTKGIEDIKTLLGPIGIGIGTIATQTNPAKLAEAAETGVCNASKPGGCMQNALNPLQKGIDSALSSVGPAGALALQNAQILNNTISILNLLNTVYSYSQTFYNYTKGRFDKLWDFLGIDRLLNVLNFAIGLHNAAMLSKNLGATLIETTNSVLGALKVKNPDGEEINIGPIIGSTIDSWMASLLGASVWAGTKDVWRRANRILTAAARLKDATYAFGNSIAEMGETLGENIAQLSNGLIDEGLISPDTLDYKDPKPKFRQHFGKTQQFLQNLNESAEAINEFAQQIIESTELATEMDKAFDELKEQLENGGKEKKDTEKDNTENSSTTATITRADTREGDYGS